MSKCTKIFDNLYLNLKQIVTFEVLADEQLKIITSAHPETNESIMFITFSADADTVLGRATEGFIYVELQELQRIKSEVSKFMGITHQK
jgi:hypothetical protein